MSVRVSRWAFLKAHVNHIGDECVFWPYAQLATGYGSVEFEGRTVRAHRLMCQLKHGSPLIPALDACHTCRLARLCINPNHLRWGTRTDNMADAIEHGTTTQGERHANHKLSEPEVFEIIDRLVLGEIHESIAESYNVHRNSITDIAKGRSWAHVPRKLGIKRRRSPRVHNDIAHALTGEGFDASCDGTGRGTPLVTVPVSFRALWSRRLYAGFHRAATDYHGRRWNGSYGLYPHSGGWSAHRQIHHRFTRRKWHWRSWRSNVHVAERQTACGFSILL